MTLRSSTREHSADRPPPPGIVDDWLVVGLVEMPVLVLITHDVGLYAGLSAMVDGASEGEQLDCEQDMPRQTLLIDRTRRLPTEAPQPQTPRAPHSGNKHVNRVLPFPLPSTSRCAAP